MGFFNSRISRTRDKAQASGNLSMIVDQTWILVNAFDDNEMSRFIFRDVQNELLISKNGRVKREKWEYIPGSNAMLIGTNGEESLFYLSYIKPTLMILTTDHETIPLIYLNESHYRNKYAKINNKHLYDQVVRDLDSTIAMNLELQSIQCLE